MIHKLKGGVFGLCNQNIVYIPRLKKILIIDAWVNPPDENLYFGAYFLDNLCSFNDKFSPYWEWARNPYDIRRFLLDFFLKLIKGKPDMIHAFIHFFNVSLSGRVYYPYFVFVFLENGSYISQAQGQNYIYVFFPSCPLQVRGVYQKHFRLFHSMGNVLAMYLKVSELHGLSI